MSSFIVSFAVNAYHHHLFNNVIHFEVKPNAPYV